MSELERPKTTATVVRVVEAEGRSRIDGSRGARTFSVTVPGTGQPARARRWLGTVRRVDRVVITVLEDAVICRVSGMRTRRPFTTSVPLAIGLGLTTLGFPASVEGLD